MTDIMVRVAGAVIQFQAALILSVVVSYENLWVSVLINAPT